MSHSSGIGQDVHEATNGKDTSDTCNGMATHASSSQVQTCGDEVTCLEEEEREGVCNTDTSPPHNMNSTCRPKYTNSEPHTSDEASTHTDTPVLNDSSHSVHTQPVAENITYMDMANTAHTHEWMGTEETEVKKQTDGSHDAEVKVSKDYCADVSVQIKETNGENSTTSQTPPIEPPTSNSASQDESHSGASTPPEQTPPLVPAPLPDSASSVLPDPDDLPRPAHVMAEVRVRSAPLRERVVRGMQDSKSLDGISNACGGGSRTAAGRGGQAEGRRATISSALELEGTVSHDGDLTNFITENLEQKIKMSSRDTDSNCSSPARGRGSLRRPADIPPIDSSVLLDLHKHTQEVANSVEVMLRSLNGTIQNMTALSVGYIQTYRDSVDSLGESVDMSIKGMYTLMARCEELDRSMQPIQTLAAQIRDIKRTLDALEAIYK
ncbi:BLOC-1 related complex subunit 6 isoform X2 [Trichomycterus rosablanca]|uniref:BLOC-1 related complex subunit 6 isoform X2 n=1 Tax=Trichomycterus rosablanca TaxID=2290929 RepID=UPI002F35C902